jgi:hypothetical protein
MMGANTGRHQMLYIEEAQAQARLAWTTRAPILSESELKKLEENT